MVEDDTLYTEIAVELVRRFKNPDAEHRNDIAPQDVCEDNYLAQDSTWYEVAKSGLTDGPSMLPPYRWLSAKCSICGGWIAVPEEAPSDMELAYMCSFCAYLRGEEEGRNNVGTDLTDEIEADSSQQTPK